MPTCCGRLFSANGIRNHLDNSAYHQNEIECRWCLERWPSHQGRQRLAHEQAEHWYGCDHCDYIFETQTARDKHATEAHPPHYCKPCQRSFMNANNLAQHLRSSVHVGKAVKCPFCDIRFTNYTGVCLHLESGVCRSGVTRQKINEYCRQHDPKHQFTTKQIGWHGDDSDDDGDENIATGASWDGYCYRCYVCSAGFRSVSALNQHLRSPVHRAKIYHCNRCRREYVALSGLVNHLESESCGEFRFSSNTAGLGFVRQLGVRA